ncbi:hypothetical protein JCM3766R1_004033 [Sporobolomyces carnicolor]
MAQRVYSGESPPSFRTKPPVVGLSLGKECLLEAELARRQLKSHDAKALSTSPLRNVDPDDVFATLREWVMQISALGALCRPSGPANLTTHLSELVAHRLAPASPTPSSSLVTFVLALYVERTVSTLALVLVEQIASIVARRSSVDQVVATVQDLEVAFKEDERVWSWVGEFNVRNLIEFPGGANESSASAAARRHRRRESINPTTLEQGPPHKVVVGSEPTLESVHATRGGGGVPLRRASVDSYKSANNGFGFLPTRDANVARHVQQQHRRKPSLALSVVQSLNSTSLSSPSSPGGDPFDQVLNSGETVKLSITPDRLRGGIELERRAAKKEQQQASSEPRDSRRRANDDKPNVAALDPVGAASGSTGGGKKKKKLQARGPHPNDVFNEDDEQDDPYEGDDSKRQGTRTSSMIDLLNSRPPWSSSPPSSSLSSWDHRERMAASAAIEMVPQPSQSSSATTTTTTTSGSSGGEDAWVNVSPEKRQRGLKAKDERRDVASERQINHDLASFFRDSPPTSSSPSSTVVTRAGGLAPSSTRSTGSPSLSSLTPALAVNDGGGGKRSKGGGGGGGLRGFMNRVTSRRGGGAASSFDDPTSSLPPPLSAAATSTTTTIEETNPFMSLPEPAAVTTTTVPNAQGSRPPRMRSFSAQSAASSLTLGRGGGATDYALPPGLGGTPDKDKSRRSSPRERQRSSGSLTTASQAHRGERLQLASSGAAATTSRPHSPPPPPPPPSSGGGAVTNIGGANHHRVVARAPVSILKTDSTRRRDSGSSRSSEPAAATSLSPPVPYVVPPYLVVDDRDHEPRSVAASISSSSGATVVRPKRSSSLKREHRRRQSSHPSSTSSSQPRTTLVPPFVLVDPNGDEPRLHRRGSISSSRPEVESDVATTTTPERFSSSEDGATFDDEDDNNEEDESRTTTDETDHVDGDDDVTEKANIPPRPLATVRPITLDMTTSSASSQGLCRGGGERSSSSSSTASGAGVAPSSPVKLKQLLLVDSTTSTASSSTRSISPISSPRSPATTTTVMTTPPWLSLSPVKEVSHPNLVGFVDQQQQQQGGPENLDVIGRGGETEIVRVLHELRKRMMMRDGCESRDECVSLVDSFIHRYNSALLDDDNDDDEEARQSREEARKVTRGEEGEEVRGMVEYFLEG